MLRENLPRKAKLEADLREKGYPAYTTQVGWLGYTDEKIKELCKKHMDLGFTAFKVKVGANINDDIRRCGMVRDAIGNKNKLMLDANQVWEIKEAIECMKQLVIFKPMWIEEPTNSDDEHGHIEIQMALKKLGIGLATGEMFDNRIKFKQYFKFRTIDYCQIDSVRVGGVNEILSIYFMAKVSKGKFLIQKIQFFRLSRSICNGMILELDFYLREGKI